ncbi:MAG: PilZ domain-containing protein [Deltaproteobacteria bacterium]|nr:PilZ domain-containing protein [Deltaproteobacteria bacterium]
MDRQPTQGPPTDRRSAPRVACDQPVLLSASDRSYRQLVATDLSTSGMRVCGTFGRIGERIGCQLRRVPREPISLDCRVVWISRTERMGLKFEAVSVIARQRLVRLVHSLGSFSDVDSPAIDPFAEDGSWAEPLIEREGIDLQPLDDFDDEEEFWRRAETVRDELQKPGLPVAPMRAVASGEIIVGEPKDQ